MLTGVGAAALASGASRVEKTVLVGDTSVRLVIFEYRRLLFKRGLIYFHPHESEHGSAVVTRHVVEQIGGKLIEIRCRGERLITFHTKGRAYSFDPNRMFTDVGLSHSLTHFGPPSDPALACAKKLRTAVLAEFDNGKTPLIAVHNNVQDGMTALSFRPGGPLSEQAAQIATNPKANPHNFFFVLNQGIFTSLHHAGFNTVLQAADPPDDGSLSVFCQRQGWTYINVEASEDDMDGQKRMLEAIPAALSANPH